MPSWGVELDHLVVAAATLEAGVVHVAAALGVPEGAFSAEGKHALLGTHNRLVNLGGSCYLEVIAIDPAAPAPTRARWFGLDDPSQQARLAQRPRLLTWVARLQPPADLSALAAQQQVPPVVAMHRGDFRWRIAVPDDGSLPSWAPATCSDSSSSSSSSRSSSVVGGGILPTVIQWDVPQTPAELLAPSGLSLRRLVARHPQPASVRLGLAALHAEALVCIDDVATPEAGLQAEIETPTGLRILT